MQNVQQHITKQIVKEAYKHLLAVLLRVIVLSPSFTEITSVLMVAGN